MHACLGIFLSILHTLETLPTTLLTNYFLSVTSAHKGITQSTTQTFLEDACKIKIFIFTRASSKRMRSWTQGWKDVYKMISTFHVWVIPQGRTRKCYFMTQGLTNKKPGMWGPRGSWILSYLLHWSRFCAKIPWLMLRIFLLEHKCLLR